MAGDPLPRPGAAAGTPPAFLIMDTESVPDGRLLGKIKYPDQELTADQAVRKAQEEARANSYNGSDFLPVSFQYPVAVCILRVGRDFALQSIKCLDAPEFRTREIVAEFWRGLALCPRAKLVTFNGRGFDLPLLELAAFRYGCCGRDYYQGSRNRYGGNHLDLLDWLGNYGASRMAGGLDLLAKLLGNPGKHDMSGDQVYDLYQLGRVREINEYCLFDTLDTYFVFLRTRVMAGEITLQQEEQLVAFAREWLTGKAADMPALLDYLGNWGDRDPWP
jgi:predicted PolB exonuclease-like 3'-5' exonuclease